MNIQIRELKDFSYNNKKHDDILKCFDFEFKLVIEKRMVALIALAVDMHPCGYFGLA